MMIHTEHFSRFLFNPLTPTAATWVPYSYNTSCARPGYAVICNFWHPDTLTLSPERQSAQMSKITYDGLTRPVWHRMCYSCTHMAVEWASKG